eukprot:TRINITY_DN29877_c0_g1_i1.p1 TRINITY_DN29877_c0_g1~~TRINITY_DN29877_c0_g1_i1.p1  ORF type:complete len:1608 (+),score=662.86 TRINITY_DN29877_c0_g1_i1:80-4903(+)
MGSDEADPGARCDTCFNAEKDEEVYGRLWEAHNNTFKWWNLNCPSCGQPFHTSIVLRLGQAGLESTEVAFGSDSREMAVMLTNLGYAAGRTGDSWKQLELQEQALKIKEKLFGDRHPEIARAFGGIAAACGQLGDVVRQKDFLERALVMQEASLGEESKEVAITLVNLAKALEGETDEETVERRYELLERAAGIKEKLFGKEDLRTAATFSHLASVFGAAGQLQRQRAWFERALETLELQEAPPAEVQEELGRTLVNLAAAHGQLGNIFRQRSYMEKALALKEKLYGEEHPEVARALTGLSKAIAIDFSKESDATLIKQQQKRAVKILEASEPESADLGIALAVLGVAYHRLEQSLEPSTKARDTLEKALKILLATCGEEHLEVATCKANLGVVWASFGDYQKQADMLLEAVTVKEKLGAQSEGLLGTSLSNLGRAYGRLNEGTKEVEALERALALQEKNYGDTDVKRDDVFATVISLGQAYAEIGDSKKHVQLLERSVKIQEELHKGDKKHPDMAPLLLHLAYAYGCEGELKKRRDALLRSLDILQTAGASSNQAAYALTLTNLGAAVDALGDSDKALDILERALAAKERVLAGKDDDIELVPSLLNVAHVCSKAGKQAREKETLEKVLKLKEKALGRDSCDLIEPLVQLGMVHAKLGNFRPQLGLLDRALGLARKHLGEGSFGTVAPLLHLATACGKVEERTRQKQYLEEALGIQEKELGEDHLDVAVTVANLGIVSGAMGEIEKQRDFLERALAIKEKHLGRDDPEVAHTLVNLGRAYGHLKEWQKQRSLFERGLEIYEKSRDWERLKPVKQALKRLRAAMAALDAEAVAAAEAAEAEAAAARAAEEAKAAAEQRRLAEEKEAAAAKQREEEAAAAAAAEEAAAAQRAIELAEEEELSRYLPNPAEMLKNLRDGDDSLTATDYARMQQIFNRFKDPGSTDMHKDELPGVLKLLGYMVDDAEEVKNLANELSDFGTIDIEEFSTFATRFKTFEKQKFKQAFEKYDEDKSGELSTDELVGVMSGMGFTPLRAMIHEAVELVDQDLSGQISFSEFVEMLAIYRYSEGFTRPEVKEFFRCFKELSEEEDGELQIAPSLVTELLLQFFGPQSAKMAIKLGEEAKEGPKRQTDANKPADTKDKPQGLLFAEALVTARRLRECEFGEWREAFEATDEDGSGQLDIDEVQNVIKQLGYTIPLLELEEIMAEVEEAADEDGVADCLLDYDEFVYMMGIFKQRDGFTKTELEMLRQTFERFDEDGSGEVETIELSDMLRYLGLTVSLEEVQRLLGQADPNDSGSLDWREFIRFMRLQREQELAGFREVFANYEAENVPDRISKQGMYEALREMGFEDASTASTKKSKRKTLKLPGVTEDFVTFDDFVTTIHEARNRKTIESRKMAGFSTLEISRFRDMFHTYDEDRSGTIEPREVGQLIESLGFSMRTAEERDLVQKLIEKSRSNAIASGVQDVGTGGSLTIWVLIQLLRLLYNDRNQKLIDRERTAMEETKYTAAEGKEYREVFVNWFQQEQAFEEAAGHHTETTADTAKDISRDGVKRLLGALGLKLSNVQSKDLDNKVHTLNESGRVDFADFLRVMRWMQDTNFANINGTG